MKHRYLLGGLLILTLLAWCGTKVVTQPVSFGIFTFQLANTYILVPAVEGADVTYRSDVNDESSIVQVAQARVDSGVTLEQMASLNLQKLELSLPWYAFVEQSARSVDCQTKHDGEIVSFITQQEDSKLFHSQYYVIINWQWYVWSVSSTIDNTRKIITDIVKSVSCA